MSISIVNGYLCTSSCDAAKARIGQDPHPRSAVDQTPNAKPDSTQTPAVVFGGALAGRNAGAPVGAAQNAGAGRGDPPASLVDIRA